MDIQALLGLLGGADLGKIASQLNVNDTEAKKGLTEALPTILEALGKNTSTTEGAEALDRALEKHDGSVLSNMTGYLSNPDLKDGMGILGHLFGGSTQNVASAVSKASGINLDGSTKLLQMLAPLVMGTLGQVKKETNLSASGLNGIITMAAAALKAQNGDTNGLMSALGGILDSNKDGNVADDLLNLAGSFFCKK
ncbi:MAG: DUF937 domain-containing protein [Fusobacterium gastrosuis]|uniref:DUF937 domain-containing protein n=1 Tax=Fusobacterium gastrosuis TaxID=1755100 RepID=UPI002A9893C8|nr:DUF937 domain-containing protein [Fusobacterium gastrosuis]